MPSSTEQRPYVHEMVVVHRLFRRESDLLPRIVRAIPEHDAEAVARTADAIARYVGGLHNHHAVEDELVWPKLWERVGTAAYSQQMEKQHAAIDASLVAVGSTLGAWRASGARPEAEALADALDAHSGCLVEHLDDEEALALPQISEHLTVEEWNMVGARGLEGIPRNRLLLALGAILEDATPAEAAFFLGKVPLAGRLLWRISGRRQYAARVRVLRGPIL